jgi:hypothetical protein
VIAEELARTGWFPFANLHLAPLSECHQSLNGNRYSKLDSQHYRTHFWRL